MLLVEILWIVIVALAVVPCVILVQEALNRFFHNPTVISLERDHWNFRVTYPSITLCPQNIRQDLLEPLKTEYKASDNFEDFLKILLFGNFSIYKELQQYKKEYGGIDPNSYLKINDNITNLGKYVNVKVMGLDAEMDKVITEYGFCFTFNSNIAKYNTYEYWMNNDSNFVNHQFYEITPDEEDPLFNMDSVVGMYNLFIHCAEDIIDLQSPRVFIGLDALVDFLVSSTTTWTPNNVRSLTIEQRHCRFPDESNLKYSPIYSYKLCKIECRIKMALKLCQCIPFYYRNRYGEKICDIDGMICLSNYDQQLIHLVTKNGTSLCTCTPNCKDEIITTISSLLSGWIQDSRITLSYQFRSKVRYMKTIIFSLADMIVQIGGLTGFCYGLSMLSAVELIYFITLRFFCGVILNRMI